MLADLIQIKVNAASAADYASDPSGFDRPGILSAQAFVQRFKDLPMHFNVKIANTKLDLPAIEEAIRGVDPSALVDIDPSGQMLRIAASMHAGRLLELMVEAGYPVTEDRLERIPSDCCGGCGG